MAIVKIYPISDIAVVNEPSFGFNGQADRTRYTPVDEVVADDNTTYIYHGSATLSSATYGMTQLSGYSGNINKITVNMRAGNFPNSNSGQLTIHNLINGTQGTAIINTTTNAVYYDYTEDWATNPATGLAWTWEDINNLVAGFDIVESSSKFYGRVTQYNISVDYEMIYTRLQGIIAQGVIIS